MGYRKKEIRVDIYHYPQAKKEGKVKNITIGDMHSNPIKMVFLAFFYQLIAFKSDITNPEDKYQEFVAICEDMEKLTQEILENECALMQEEIESKIPKQTEINPEVQEKLAKIKERFEAWLPCIQEGKNYQTSLRFMGDMCADRGPNDYFILKLLAKFSDLKINYKILFSNHDYELIHAYEQLFALPKNTLKPANLLVINDSISSLAGLRLFYRYGQVTKEELKDLIDNHYKPFLCLLDYEMVGDIFYFFTHAPNSLSIVSNLMFALYKEQPDEKIYTDSKYLRKCLDKINQKFKQWKDNNTISNFMTIMNRNVKDYEENPLYAAIWSRWNKIKEAEYSKQIALYQFPTVNVCGHDTLISKHLKSLDDEVGKLSKNALREDVNEIIQYVRKILDEKSDLFSALGQEIEHLQKLLTLDADNIDFKLLDIDALEPSYIANKKNYSKKAIEAFIEKLSSPFERLKTFKNQNPKKAWTEFKAFLKKEDLLEAMTENEDFQKMMQSNEHNKILYDLKKRYSSFCSLFAYQEMCLLDIPKLNLFLSLSEHNNSQPLAPRTDNADICQINTL